MLKRNIKLVFSTNALMLCSGVVTSLLSSWALGPEGRGDLMIVLTWPAVFSMVAAAGLPQANRFWTAKHPDRVSPLFSNAVLFSLLVGIIALAAGEVMIPRLVGERSPEVLRLVRIYALIIPMGLITDLMRGLLEGMRRFEWVGAVRLIFFVVQLVGFIVLWFTGTLTVANATYIMLSAIATSMFLALFAVWRQLTPSWRPRMSEFRNALRYGLRDYPGILTELANWRLDSLMLTSIASNTSVGLYSVAVRLSDIPTLLASSVSDAVMPEVAASNKKKATWIVTRSLRLTVLAHLLLLLPLWLAAPYILHFAYGDGFVPVTNVLRLLMIASVIWSAGAIVISGLNGLGHPGLSTIARIAAALVMVVTLLTWLPRWGIRGAALSSITGYSVMFVVALFWFLRVQKISLWECLRPRWDDVPPVFTPAGLRAEIYKFGRRATQSKARATDAIIAGSE
ncbi:MAG TPA: flippase [Pyrinomonadaceae bacterium]|nr:flippase [Pyrinomonadaceae bacterium]